MASAVTIEKVARPELAKHDSSILDLVFVMDCTGSMASYIASATNNIRAIVEEIVVSEKSDIHLALIEYRDHPPQDHTFVTRVHDFTAKVSEMKGWLEQCQATGGGDTPEAVADGLHAALKLSWRAEATKICILIADAPPHGLDPSGDSFPNGCPNGLDPVQIVQEMAQKHITLYSVGVEPPITPYRDFFMALAYTTGGQYVPMVNSKLLAKVIIGGVREELSLERLMEAAQEDIRREMQQAEAEGLDEKEKIKRVSTIFAAQNLHSTTMANPFGMATTTAKAYSSTCQNMPQMQQAFLSSAPPNPFLLNAPPPPPSLYPFSTPTTAVHSTPPMSFSFASPTSAPSPFSFGTAATTVPTGAPASFSFGPPASASTSFSFGATPTTASTSNPSLFGSPAVARVETDMGYSITENTTVNEDQAERIYQKWQQRNK